MKFAFHKLSILTLGLVALGFVQPASAAYEVQMLNFGSALTPLSTPFTSTLSFNQFDTTTGTLTGVTIQLNAGMMVTSLAANPTGTVGSYTGFENTGSINIQGPDSTSIMTSLSTPPGGGTLQPISFTTVGTNSSTSLSVGPTSVLDLTAYEGAGTGTFNVSATGNNSFSGSSSTGNVFVGGGVSAYGTVTITFDYMPNAVPEPASMAMLAIGLGGVGAFSLIRRNRRRTA